MRNKISFIAIGQAGGNIGQLFEKKGFNVLYLNTSKEDLGTLTEAKYKYHITGGEGCNKDRRKAKQLIIDDYDRISSEIADKIKADMIFVIFASGGGTGSGAGPMLVDLMLDNWVNVGAITVLPAPDESVKAHVNAYECFSELMEISTMASCFILDNGKGDKMQLNGKFVKDFCSFLEIPDRHKSVKGNIDKAEIIETLRAHGMAVALRQKARQSADMIQALRNNIFAPMQQDGTVKYIAASLSDAVRMGDLEKALGVPLDNFQTFNNEETICCVSGLSFPKARLDAIYEKVSKDKDVIKKNLAAVQDFEMKKDINFLEETQQVKKPAIQKKSKRDIMSKYLV